MNNPLPTTPTRTLGGILGEICEANYLDFRDLRSPQMNALMVEVAQTAGVDLEPDELFTLIAPEQERAVYRELAKRYLVRFQDAHEES